MRRIFYFCREDILFLMKVILLRKMDSIGRIFYFIVEDILFLSGILYKMK